MLQRKLLGPMAAWDLSSLLLRQVVQLLAGANWQRSGGKGQRPKPIALPDKKRARSAGPDVAQRLRNLGLIPAGDAANPPPAAPTADKPAEQADTMWLDRHQRIASE